MPGLLMISLAFRIFEQRVLVFLPSNAVLVNSVLYSALMAPLSAHEHVVAEVSGQEGRTCAGFAGAEYDESFFVCLSVFTT